MRFDTLARLSLPVLAATLLLAAGAEAQRRQGRKPVCPYCLNDPTIMRKAGIVNHGPFKFAQHPKHEEGKVLTTADIDKMIDFEQILWIETRHMKLGCCLRPYVVPQDEKLKIRAELKQLKELGLRRINVRARHLDPWLRLHLFALRAEKAYSDFKRTVRKTDTDFPRDPKDCYRGEGEERKHMGMGPYLGQPDKYELLITGSEKAFVLFMERYLGHRGVKPKRHNFTKRGALFTGLGEYMRGHRRDTKLHNSMVFNISINFLNGYRFYAYNLPVWLTEGMGHYFERANSPFYNSFDGNEGSVANARDTWKWRPMIRSRVARGKNPPLAKVFRKRDFGALLFEDHLVIWSVVEFLATRHAEKFARFLDSLKGRITDKGVSGISGLLKIQRKALQQHFHWSPFELEDAWKKHVLKTYPVK